MSAHVGSVFVVGQGHVAKQTVIYCNDINRTKTEIEKSAGHISQLFKQEVLVFHNPTTFATMTNADLQEKAANNLMETIETCLPPRARVVLLAHGHGAMVVRRALEKLAVDSQNTHGNKIHCYTFGGATMVPRLASKVHNYVIDGEAVSKGVSDEQSHMKAALEMTKPFRDGTEEPIINLGKALQKVIKKSAKTDKGAAILTKYFASCDVFVVKGQAREASDWSLIKKEVFADVANNAGKYSMLDYSQIVLPLIAQAEATMPSQSSSSNDATAAI
ncbi:hypothetical protein COB21_05905 [Candidatus Aerophobetes bacterium]|uniref:DUF676 domain-containing protein n=1 Tax=Aerophobetes bacterium TaxID=2030807 RepID=A0A2A4WY43_UNCAE|nr:MAG: hypothetical protein COB21_05905 [Candidatus Aerophobetes bacterium]